MTDGNLPVFCASKSYSHTLSSAMCKAYDPRKLDVMTVTPGIIIMNKVGRVPRWATSPEAHAKAVID